MPRRYHVYPEAFAFWNALSSGGAAILALAYLLPIFYLGWSMIRGARAGADPWEATGLEWRTSSPPPKENFTTQPIVRRPAYDYHHKDDQPEERRRGAHRPQDVVEDAR